MYRLCFSLPNWTRFCGTSRPLRVCTPPFVHCGRVYRCRMNPLWGHTWAFRRPSQRKCQIGTWTIGGCPKTLSPVRNVGASFWWGELEPLVDAPPGRYPLCDPFDRMAPFHSRTHRDQLMYRLSSLLDLVWSRSLSLSFMPLMTLAMDFQPDMRLTFVKPSVTVFRRRPPQSRLPTRHCPPSG